MRTVFGQQISLSHNWPTRILSGKHLALLLLDRSSEWTTHTHRNCLRRSDLIHRDLCFVVVVVWKDFGAIVSFLDFLAFDSASTGQSDAACMHVLVSIWVLDEYRQVDKMAVCITMVVFFWITHHCVSLIIMIMVMWKMGWKRRCPVGSRLRVDI
jgi:hypothetical protein